MRKFEEMVAANPALKEAVEKGILRPPRIEEGPIPEGKPVDKRMDCDSHEVAP